MKMTLAALMIALPIPSYTFAQDDFFEGLNSLDGRTVITEDATPEALWKEFGPSHGAALSDVELYLQQGGEVYVSPNSALLVTPDKDAILLLRDPSGEIVGYDICRIIPVCIEKPN